MSSGESLQESRSSGRSYSLLRFLLPVLIFSTTLLVSIRLLRLNEASALEIRRTEAETMLTQQLMTLHTRLDEAADPPQLVPAMQLLTLDPAVEDIALIDGEGTVLSSTRRLLSGRDAASVLPGYDVERAGEAIRTMSQVLVSEPGSARVQSYLPVRLRPGSVSGAPATGLLYGRHELEHDFANIGTAARNIGLRTAALLAALALFLNSVLHLAVVRRLRRVITAMNEVADGRLERRTGVVGADEIGAVGRAFNTMADRLDRQRNEIATVQERYRQMIEGSPDLIYVCGLDGTVVFANQASRRILGMEPEDCIGRNAIELVAPEDRPEVAEWMARMAALQLEVSTHELRIVRPDGTARELEVTGRRVRGESGSSLLVECVARDRTELRAAERERQASVLRFQAVFEGALDAVLLVDAATGLVLEANRAAVSLAGASRNDLVGTPIEDLFPGILEATDDAAGADALMKRPDGTTVPVEASHGRVVMPDGAAVLQVTCRDLREKRRMEERVAHVERMSVIGQLAGGVAHDFNNQLAGILGYAELLERRLPEGPLREYARRIENSAQVSADLTRKLLAFSRRGKFEDTDVDMNTVLDDVAGVIRPSLGPDIAIRVEHAPQAAWVRGDASQLQNAVLNLAVNARDAMPAGGTLALSAHFANDTVPAPPPEHTSQAYVEVRVRDTGTGMDAATLAHAFEPYFTTKPVGAGTGLGLAAVYGTVTGHRGTVMLESKPGCGTTCRFWLPRVAPGPASTADQEAETPGGARILIADDEGSVREMLRQLLEEGGFSVTTCAGGAEAVEAWEGPDGPFALALIDMRMPGVDGVEASTRIKALSPDARILILSGYADEQSTRRAAQAGVLRVLRKPCPRQELLAAIRDALA